ncbi:MULTISPECIES: glycerate kinase [unclassified Knoellia]|uniref:glycerate kinase n=1 Tax=Knoellia altitudinis TaxID=3404795 RepID=UPI003619F630
MTRVLLAPDKFKGTLTAAEVAEHVGRGLRAALGDVEDGVVITRVAVADGGDGMVAAALEAGHTEVAVTVSGPTGTPRQGAYAVSGTGAVIEMAGLCGLALLGDDLAPLTASSRGLGEALAHALDAGAERVVLGIGGSASTDGGAGMLAALGAQVFDASGQELPDGGGALASAAGVDLTGLHPRLPEVELHVACDVDNPLTGVRGAAAVYGPQKGADPEQVEALDAALSRWADLLDTATGAEGRDVPGAGAAGGVGYAALVALGGRLRPGVELALDLTGFARALEGADLVVTGEGSLDEQTLNGKAPAGVARAARAHGIPVVAVAGRCELSPETLATAGIERAWALTDLATEPDEAFRAPGPLLERAGAEIGRWLLERDRKTS